MEAAHKESSRFPLKNATQRDGMYEAKHRPKVQMRGTHERALAGFFICLSPATFPSLVHNLLDFKLHDGHV